MNFEEAKKTLKVGDIFEVLCGESSGGKYMFIGLCSMSCMLSVIELNNDLSVGKNYIQTISSYTKKPMIIKIIKNNNENKIMKITNIVKQILDQDTRKLVRAGFINGDLALTEEGITELLGMIFSDKKAELVKLADEKINDKKL